MTDLELASARFMKADAILTVNTPWMFQSLKDLIADYEKREGFLERDAQEYGYVYEPSQALKNAKALIAQIEKDIAS